MRYEKVLVYLFFLFILLLATYIAFISSFGLQVALNYISMVFTNVTVSRVVSISLGHGLSLSYDEIIIVNFMTESILVLLVYSIFLYTLKKVDFFQPITQRIHHLQSIALRHKDSVNKYGLVGLFFFVFIPFWMTGPIVGVIIGHLMNINPLKNITVVLLGTLFAITIWSISLQNIMQAIGF